MAYFSCKKYERFISMRWTINLLWWTFSLLTAILQSKNICDGVNTLYLLHKKFGYKILVAYWCFVLYGQSELVCICMRGEGAYLYSSPDHGEWSSRRIMSRFDEGQLRGFLWISTGDEVTRYDGYEFLTFNASKGVRLKNNFVLKFCEDRFGRIWMVGERGLDVMDVEHLRLVNPRKKWGISLLRLM